MILKSELWGFQKGHHGVIRNYFLGFIGCNFDVKTADPVLLNSCYYENIL